MKKTPASSAGKEKQKIRSRESKSKSSIQLQDISPVHSIVSKENLFPIVNDKVPSDLSSASKKPTPRMTSVGSWSARIQLKQNKKTSATPKQNTLLTAKNDSKNKPIVTSLKQTQLATSKSKSYGTKQAKSTPFSIYEDFKTNDHELPKTIITTNHGDKENKDNRKSTQGSTTQQKIIQMNQVSHFQTSKH